MILDLSKMHIFVRPGSTDLRKAVNGLSVLAESRMGKNPFEPNLFLFSNADRKLFIEPPSTEQDKKLCVIIEGSCASYHFQNDDFRRTIVYPVQYRNEYVFNNLKTT